jgi:hypothetical protein
MRIIIRARVTEIPGNANRRDISLGEIFLEKVLSRPFRREITPQGYDLAIIPPSFNLENPVSIYYLQRPLANIVQGICRKR